MKPGDHIYLWNSSGTMQHGIHLGAGTIVELANGAIHQCSLQEFSKVPPAAADRRCPCRPPRGTAGASPCQISTAGCCSAQQHDLSSRLIPRTGEIIRKVLCMFYFPPSPQGDKNLRFFRYGDLTRSRAPGTSCPLISDSPQVSVARANLALKQGASAGHSMSFVRNRTAAPGTRHPPRRGPGPSTRRPKPSIAGSAALFSNDPEKFAVWCKTGEMQNTCLESATESFNQLVDMHQGATETLDADAGPTMMPVRAESCWALFHWLCCTSCRLF